MDFVALFIEESKNYMSSAERVLSYTPLESRTKQSKSFYITRINKKVNSGSGSQI